MGLDTLTPKGAAPPCHPRPIAEVVCYSSAPTSRKNISAPPANSQSFQGGEAGASAGPTSGSRAGESVSAEQAVVTITKDGTVTGAEKPEVKVNDTIGGNTTVNSSGEQIGLGLQAPLGPEPIVGGAEVGTTREGLNALKDAASEVKDSLKNPGPPPPPKPPTPPCSNDSSNKCPH